MAKEIRVPALGESVTEATIAKWFRKPGEAVKADEPLVELETDKVTIEVPAPAAGVLSEVIAKDGATVAVGALLGQIREGKVRALAGISMQSSWIKMPRTRPCKLSLSASFLNSISRWARARPLVASG